LFITSGYDYIRKTRSADPALVENNSSRS